MKMGSYIRNITSSKLICFNLVWVLILLIKLLIKIVDGKVIDLTSPNLLYFLIFILVGNGSIFLESKKGWGPFLKKNDRVFFFLNVIFLIVFL